MNRFYLCQEKGELQKSIYPLEGSMTIGRSAENDITLVDSDVSRSHARISLETGSWTIEDLGSSTGIILGGERIDKRALKSGDAFQIGGITLTFMEEGAFDKTEQLSETMQVFAALIKYQSPFVNRNRTNPGFMRLQGALMSNPIFRSLGKKELRGLEDFSNLHLFSPDQLIFQEGDPGRSIYLILDGGVKVFTKDHNGKEFQLATLKSNQFFGEMALLSGEPRSSSVATLGETLLGEISYNNMRRLIMRYPEIKEVLLEYFRERVEDSRKKRAEANIEDRRVQPRLQERLMATFTVWPELKHPQEMVDHTYKATTSDISGSGAKLEVLGPALRAFRSGCKIELFIELPAPWGEILTEGKVRHVTLAGTTAQLGIEFIEISDEDMKKLHHFLYGQTDTFE
jgi:CRP-like cAMP-binding protein